MRINSLLILLVLFFPVSAMADKLSADKVVDKAVEAAADEIVDQAKDEIKDYTGLKHIDDDKDGKRSKKDKKIKLKSGKYKVEYEVESETHGEYVSQSARDDDRERGESMSEVAQDRDNSTEKRWWEFWKD